MPFKNRKACKTDNSDFKAKLNHFDDDGYLYFNLKDRNVLERHLIWSFMINLNNNSATKSSNNYLYYQQIDFQVGDICAAIYPADKSFYRAKILSILDYEKVFVMFVDYGNCETVAKQNLEPLPAHIRQLDPLVVTCRLPSVRILDRARYSTAMEAACRAEVSLQIERDLVLSRIIGPDFVERSLVRLVNVCFQGTDLRQSLLQNRAIEDWQQDITVAPVTEPEVPPPCMEPDSTQQDSGSDVLEHVAADMPEDNVEGEILDEEHSDSPASVMQFDVKFTKSVFITSFHSSSEFYVHENSGSVKDNLHAIQQAIDRVVEKYENFTDNIFNKRNIYLARFSEDMLWYRVRIVKFDEKDGFLVQFVDWGNTEYKDSLGEFILLTREMGEDASCLMNEEAQAQRCRVSRRVKKLFGKECMAKKFFVRNFVDNVRRIKITYRIKESQENTWIVSDVHYKNQNLATIIERKFVVQSSSQANGAGRHGADVEDDDVSSNSDFQESNKKVLDYLIHNCCNEEDAGVGATTTSAAVTAVQQDCLQGRVTHVVGLADIWIDVSDCSTRDLCRSLLAAVTDFPPVSDGAVIIGELYGVHHNHSQQNGSIDVSSLQFSRGRVMAISNNLLRVHLVDVGAVVGVSIEQLSSLPQALAALPELATKFGFYHDLQPLIDEDQLGAELRRVLVGQRVRAVLQSGGFDRLVDLVVDVGCGGGGDRSLVQAMISVRAAEIMVDNFDDEWFLFPDLHRDVFTQTTSNASQS